MSDEHEHHHHHDHEHPPAPELQMQDAGTQALAEALRSSFTIVKIVMALMVVAFFCSGFFEVGPAQRAVILRFGKPVGEGQKALLGPGLHWSWPYPIDEVVKIPLTEQQSVVSTTGWYFTTPEQELSGEEIPAGPSLDPARDGFAITADRNIIHTRATLYYHIDDPIRYVFGFVSASNTLQNALNNSLLYTAAHFKVDDALYNKFGEFQDDVSERVSDLAEQEKIGIVVDSCQVKNIPPRQLTDIFSQVTESRESLNKTIQDAKNQAHTTLLNADAQAASIVYQAESASTNYVAQVTADASTFTNLLVQYKIDPSTFAQQFLVPRLADALTNVDKWFVPERADGKPRELRLELNREPPAPKAGEQNQ